MGICARERFQAAPLLLASKSEIDFRFSNMQAPAHLPMNKIGALVPFYHNQNGIISFNPIET